MVKRDRAVDGRTKWMRWIARGLGSLVAALWALIGISEIAFPHTPPSPEAELQGTILVILGATVILGVLLAWRWERLGGTILVLGAIAVSTFGYITAGRHKGWVMLFSGGPYLVVGALFLACWRRSPRSRNR